MNKTIVDDEGAAARTAAGTQTNVRPETIKLGIDIHQEWLVVVAQHDHATPRPPRRFSREELVVWVERLRIQGHEVRAVYEACGFGFGLCRKLRALGAECLVISPQSLDESHSRVKTDGRDARTLCLRLDRYLQGNRHALAVIRIPSEAQERARHLHRQREQLVRARTKMQAQGRGLLVNHDLPAPPRWWRKQAWSQLEKLVPPWMVAHLEVFRPALDVLDQQIGALTQGLQRAAVAESLPRGVGALTSVVLSREVCDWNRFHNRRQVASYTGLCPGEYSSGGKRLQGHVTKHGNPRLRAGLVELAWRLVRFQPTYPPVRKRLAVLAKGAKSTGAQRKKAIVAVARQLAIDLWRMNTGQCSAAQLGLQS